jgi:hypothetical protein
MKLAKGTVNAPASAIADVSGAPDRGQTVVLMRGAVAPASGGILVVDATNSGPGILGKVTASKRLGNGRTRLFLEPATLDQAYSRFDLRFNGSLANLVGSTSLVATGGGGASVSAVKASANKFRLFNCKGPQVKKPDILVDLTPLRVNSDIIVERRQVFFMIFGRPVMRLRFELDGGASCRLNEAAKVFIPVAGPVGIELAPVLEFSAGADSKLDFTMEPQIAVGFARGDHTNADYRVLNPREPSIDLHSSFGVDAFAGGSIGVSVGGRTGIRGKFGPSVTIQSTAKPGQVCGDVSGALRIGLEVYADVFISTLTFQVAQGDFLHRALFSSCIGSGTGPYGEGDVPGGMGGDTNPGTDEMTDPYRSVSAGGVHSCVAASDGTPVCWGNNEQGQSTPIGGPFASISAGDRHSCGVQFDGILSCWGWNAYGQSEPAGGAFKSVSAGGGHTCGVRVDATLGCWGNNDLGQASAPDGLFLSVSAGGDHTCGLRTDETVACWGSNDSQQATAPGGGFKSVGAGNDYSCGVRLDESLACWGNDIQGTGRTDPPSGAFKAVSVGENHACAVAVDDTVACWGDDNDGRATAPSGTFRSVSAGGSHTCGYKTDGTIACWGSDSFGQAAPP